MPTLPLYDAAAPPQAYHRVLAPGGYEWWKFLVPVFDGDARRLIVLAFHEGGATDVDYIERYRAYLRRPTSHPPPVPREYCAASLIVAATDGARALAFHRFDREQF